MIKKITTVLLSIIMIIQLCTVTVLADKAEEAGSGFLSDITVEGRELEPGFRPDVKSYIVQSDSKQVDFKVTPAESKMKVLVQIGSEKYENQSKYSVNLDDANSVIITVSKDEYTQQVYTLSFVYRVEPREIYVSENGSDGGEGTKESPFKTINKAMQAARAGSGDIVRVMPGTYVVQKIIIPTGVSLIGSGVDNTFIQGTVVNPTGLKNQDFGKSAIECKNVSDVELAHFTLDGRVGESDRAFLGILVDNSTNVVIHDMEVGSFFIEGIRVDYVLNCHLYNMYLHDSGEPDTGGCSSNIIFGDCKNATIHDSLIVENRGAYGIKAGLTYWQNRDPFTAIGGDWFVGLENLKIYNCDIDVRQVGGWGQGQPGIAIEFWSHVGNDCEIFNCRISDSLSLPQWDSRIQDNPLRVHHNEFVADPWVTGYTYAIECSTPNIEIDHNYFHYGIYPIANFGPTKKGVNVHHNIFHDIEQISIMHSENGYVNSRFVNNYVILTDDKHVKTYEPFMFGNISCYGIIVRDNIFYDARPNRNTRKLFKFGANGSLGDDCQVSNNLFYNWNPYGDNAVEADPKFLDNFQLAADSPARKMGIDSLTTVNAGLSENFFFQKYRGDNQEVFGVYLVRKGNTSQDLIETKVGETIETETFWKNKNNYKFRAESSQLSYNSDNTAVATIDANGLIKVVGEGVATVTAQMGGKKGTLIIVSGDEPASLRILPDKTVLLNGKTAAAKVFMDTKYGFSKDITSICTFKSSDTNALTVAADGIYTAKKQADVTISAKSTIPGMPEVSCMIRTREKMLSSINVTSDKETVYVGDDVTVSVSGKDNFGDEIDISGAEFTYTVVDNGGYVVSQDGKTAVIKALKDGVIQIDVSTYLDGTTVSGNKTVMVYPDAQQRVTAPFAMKHFGKDTGVITVADADGDAESSDANAGEQAQDAPSASQGDNAPEGAETLSEPFKAVIYGENSASVVQTEDGITLTSKGKDIWNRSDDCAFLYQKVNAKVNAIPQKVTYTATIREADLKGDNAAAGIMLRADNTASSRHISIRVKKDGALLFIARKTDGDITTYAGGPKLEFPVQLRLVKNGNAFEAYYQKNAAWQKLEMSGGDMKAFPEVVFSDTLYAGVTLFSGDTNNAVCTTNGGTVETEDMPPTDVKFDNSNITVNLQAASVQAGWSVRSGVFGFDKEYSENWQAEYTIEDTSIATVDKNGMITGVSKGKTVLNLKAISPNGGEYTATANVQVIDEIVPELQKNAYVITSNGADVWNTSDNAAFLYQPLDLRAADDPKRFEVSATIEAWTSASDNSSAGVMFRDSINENSKHVGLRLKKDGTAILIVRQSDGGSTVYASGDKLEFPATIKLIKNGGLVTAEYLINGGWKQFEFTGGDLKEFSTLKFGENALAGAFAFSGNSSEKVNFTVRDLNVTATELGLDGIALRAEQSFMPKTGQKVKVDVYGVFGLIEASDQFLPNAKITFESKNPNIATVDEDGVVTGKSTGEAIIMATAEIDGKTYTAETPVYVCVEYGSLSRSKWSVSSNWGQPINIIDGNDGSRWTMGSSQGRASYIKVDLKYNASFNTIVLYDKGGHPGKCDIYISDDGLIWGDPIISVTKPTEKTDTMTIKLPKTYQSRYIKIDQPSNSEPEWFSVHELYILNER